MALSDCEDTNRLPLSLSNRYRTIDICICPSYTLPMKILPDPVSFVWNKGNIDKNLDKHGVTNREAEEIFENKPVFIFKDVKHSLAEQRYMIWGITDKGRKLSVFFTIRNDLVRIISARDMHRKERRAYEEKIQTNTKI